ncbi:hypothetical protein BC835DRAFT_1350523 [Cytidiella melzeri]|nr:hypothetical protein BC835DRAFT_1350523 [Cytidiella melzeri]
MQSPSTPPSPTRGRMSLRYPSALSRDPARVPLHKRGKSKTYEAMEDLLREAGYKETRIFTPETDRTERGADGAGRAASRVGAVVGYLAGLVPGMNRSEEHLTQEDSISNEAQAWSMPPSPLAGRNTKPLPPDSILAADRTTRIKKTAPGSPRLDVGRGRLSLEQPLRSQPSASESLRAYAQISAAHGYLRHMSSAPNIPRNSRLTSSTDSSATTSARIPLRHRVRDQIHEEQPPLPSGWLDSVTKAVLGSSTAGAHPGQPQPTGRTQAKSAARDRPRIHSHLALSDHTNKVRPMGSLRAQTAPGAVNTVMVVCRSAPSSRSSSRVGERLILAGDKTRRDSRSRATRRSRGEEADALPSLASTLLENDSWAPQWVDGMRIPSISVEDCEYSDDDDGEIDLAQLLLPPKRQKSIRSLRQHLQRSESARSSRAPSTRPLEPYILDDDDDVATRRRNLSRERRTHRWTSSDEGSGWEGTGILGTNQHEAKRRTGLPAAWSNMASGR